jgi:hypothetical protein
MKSIESNFVIERVSTIGLSWLMRMGEHGPIWCANKRRAQRFHRRRDAKVIREELRSSITDPLFIATLDELSKR